MSRLISRLLMEAMRPKRMRHFRSLEKAQWQSVDGLENTSRNLLAGILNHACTSIPFYRDLSGSKGLEPGKLTGDDLSRFPLVTKQNLIDDQVKFIDPSVPESGRIKNSTGGSSGILFNFFNDRKSVEERMANDLRARAWTGWRPGDVQAILWGHPRDNKVTHSWRGRLLAKFVHRSLTLNAFNLTSESLTEFHGQLESLSPQLLLGYSSALDLLATWFRDQGLTMKMPRGIISSAETLTPEFRENIESVFPCRLFNRYGSREFGVIAQQCEVSDGLHVFTDQVHLEILDPEGRPCAPGELGEIVVTDLTNRVMPFIRYRTGDMAKPQAGICSCGRGFPLLQSVEGRTSELIVGKNGKFYSCPGPRFYGSGIPGIHQMQLVQESIELLTVNIVPDDLWTPSSELLLIERMKELLGGPDVVVNLVDGIAPSPSGKFPFAISRVSPFKG